MKKQKKRPLAVYVHIPFCIRKCYYCDFLSAPATDETQAEYVYALCGEIRREAKEYTDYEVISVFFGGGTPSVLKAELFAGLMKVIRESFCLSESPEITVECNPGTLNKEKLTTYRKLGVNRLSIGLQSANDEELKLLGRIHTWEEFVQNYFLARECGFDNINIDLMAALPGQTMESYSNTLSQILTLSPEHISSYGLILEEGTPFYSWFVKKEDAHGKQAASLPVLPDEETECRMYEYTGEILKKNGYHRYEISNYAKTGRECRHNICYWQRTEYIGFGPGAASQIGTRRFGRERDFSAYLKCLRQNRTSIAEQESLSIEDEMEEFMFLGMRMMKGVSLSEFQEKFKQDMHEVYGRVIRKYVQLGMMEEQDGMLRLTEAGIEVSNGIFSEFLH